MTDRVSTNYKLNKTSVLTTTLIHNALETYIVSDNTR